MSSSKRLSFSWKHLNPVNPQAKKRAATVAQRSAELNAFMEKNGISKQRIIDIKKTYDDMSYRYNKK